MKTFNTKDKALRKIVSYLRDELNGFIGKKYSTEELKSAKEEIGREILDISEMFPAGSSCSKVAVLKYPFPIIIELDCGQVLQLRLIPEDKALGVALFETFNSDELHVVCPNCKKEFVCLCPTLNHVCDDFGELNCGHCHAPWLEFSYAK
jgi:hypothetical protein